MPNLPLPAPPKLFGNIAPPLNRQTFPVMNLTGGLYRRRNPILARPDQWTTLQNFVPYQGGVKKLGGHRLHGAALSGDVRVTGLYEFIYTQDAAEQRMLLINAGGKLYKRTLPLLMSTTIFSDTFTRADAGHLGQNWIDPYTTQNFLNSIQIESNKAKVHGSELYAGGVGYAWYANDIESVDYDVKATVAFTVSSDPSINRWAGIITKIKDRDNHYRFEVSQLGARLFRRVNGADTLLGTTAIEATNLFSDGFESYTADAVPSSPWVNTGATPPKVKTTQIGPDGSAATLQIEGAAVDGAVGRSMSEKWAFLNEKPITVQFYLKQTAQDAVATVICGINENATLNNAGAFDLLKLTTAHLLQAQFNVGGGDSWISTGKTISLNKWYKIRLELFMTNFKVYVDNVQCGSGNYPGAFSGHDLGYLYFQGSTQASSTAFIDLVSVDGSEVTAELTTTALLTEDFESYTADAAPGVPWVAGWGETNFRVRTTRAHGGTKSLCIWENIGSAGHFTYRQLSIPLASNDYLDVDYYLYIEDNPDFNYNASYYPLVYLHHQYLAGSSQYGSIFYKATSGSKLALYHHDPANESNYTKFADADADTWHHFRIRYYYNKIEIYWSSMATPISTKTLTSAFSNLYSLSLYRYPTNTAKIYFDDFTVTGSANPSGGFEETVEQDLRIEHRGARMDCFVNDTLVLSHKDDGTELIGYQRAGISGYIDSTFDDFEIIGPAADTEIGDIPDGFYDYCTMLNQAVICINNGLYGISVPYRFDGTNLYRMDQLTPPTTAPTATLGSGATPPQIVTPGSHWYTVTFVDSMGNESNRSYNSGTGLFIESNEVVTDGTNNKVDLSNIPLGGTDCVARRLYRTVANGGVFMFLAEIDDNTTQTYEDLKPDEELGTIVAPEDNDPPPMAAFCCSHMNRLYLTGNPEEPDMVYVSKTGDILAFPLTLQLPFNRNSGDRNTGLAVYMDKVHLFKRRQTAYLSDTDPSYWSINMISNTIGCVSWRTLKTCHNLLMMQSENQVSALLGNRIVNMSREIDGLFDEIDPNDSYFSHAVNNLGMRRYELYYRERGQAWPNRGIFMHYDESISGDEDSTRVWSGPHTSAFSTSASFMNDKMEKRVVAGSVKNNGRVFMTEQGLNFDGVAQVSIATGPQTSFGLPDLEKRLRGIFFYWAATHVVYCQIHRDFDFYPTVTIPTLQPILSPKNKIHVSGTCRFAALTVYHDTLDEDLEIYGYSWEYQQLGLRR